MFGLAAEHHEQILQQKKPAEAGFFKS